MTPRTTSIDDLRTDLRRDWRYRFWEAVYGVYYTAVVWLIRHRPR